jgi:hypothetical protein
MSTCICGSPHSSPWHFFFTSLSFFFAVGKEEQTLPYLLFLQGGPGFECRPPTESSGWIQKVTEQFRLILMDQACFSGHLNCVVIFLIMS